MQSLLNVFKNQGFCLKCVCVFSQIINPILDFILIIFTGISMVLFLD